MSEPREKESLREIVAVPIQEWFRKENQGTRRL